MENDRGGIDPVGVLMIVLVVLLILYVAARV